MGKANDFKPFVALGGQLKNLRVAKRQSLEEVSGAVEIDMSLLKRFESGSDRPSEDVLMLLMNYFAVNDDKAVSMWQLAGYDRKLKDEDPLAAAGALAAPMMLMVAMDNRILYTDSAHIAADKNGVVFDFFQNNPKGQPMPVSRVGMSYQEASDFCQVLAKTLEEAKFLNQPKHLPAPKNPTDKE
jgi:transcriptional regulator with XRE-family HTH domain